MLCTLHECYFCDEMKEDKISSMQEKNRIHAYLLENQVERNLHTDGRIIL